MAPFQIGTVPYLNAIPLTHSLTDNPDIRMIVAPPAVLSAMLKRDQIDVGMVPTADYCRADGQWKILAPFGIVANSEVWTVKLYTNTPIDQCTQINLDAESHSSAALIKIILAEFFKRTDVVFTPATFRPQHANDDTAWLLIGDKAINGIERQFSYDLGQLWHDHTDLPFVFALWAARTDKQLDNLSDILAQTAKTNLNNLVQLADLYAQQHGFTAAIARQYFKHAISYRLNEKEFAAIQRFDALLAKHHLKGPVDD